MVRYGADNGIVENDRFHERLSFPKLSEPFQKFRKVSVIGHSNIKFYAILTVQICALVLLELGLQCRYNWFGISYVV